jgi:hypothetical protein
MAIEFDEKGKFFTDFVTKKVIRARIQTLSHYIEGEIYVRIGKRISDEINLTEKFIAVTNAVVFDPRGTELFSCNFLAVNRDHMIWLIPEEEETNTTEEGN